MTDSQKQRGVESLCKYKSLRCCSTLCPILGYNTTVISVFESVLLLLAFVWQFWSGCGKHETFMQYIVPIPVVSLLHGDTADRKCILLWLQDWVVLNHYLLWIFLLFEISWRFKRITFVPNLSRPLVERGRWERGISQVDLHSWTWFSCRISNFQNNFGGFLLVLPPGVSFSQCISEEGSLWAAVGEERHLEICHQQIFITGSTLVYWWVDVGTELCIFFIYNYPFLLKFKAQLQ